MPRCIDYIESPGATHRQAQPGSSRGNAAITLAAVIAPFAPNAYRYENGQAMPGPDCTFAPCCQNIATRSFTIFERLWSVATRLIDVDERLGIVRMRMA